MIQPTEPIGIDAVLAAAAKPGWWTMNRPAVEVLVAEVERLTAERNAYADRVDTLTAVAKSNKAAYRGAVEDCQRLTTELATARAAAFHEAARVLEDTGRDDDAVNLLDNIAHGITTHAAQDGPQRPA